MTAVRNTTNNFGGVFTLPLYQFFAMRRGVQQLIGFKLHLVWCDLARS